jgi:hypothetical protein
MDFALGSDGPGEKTLQGMIFSARQPILNMCAGFERIKSEMNMGVYQGEE